VVVSGATIDELTAQQLHAVLAHEAAHVRGHHPAALLAVTALSAPWSFMWRSVDRWVRNWHVQAELEADAHAIGEVGRLPLARALLVLADGQRPPHGAVGATSALAPRIEAVTTADGQAYRPGRLAVVLAAALGVLCLLGAAVTTSPTSAVEVTRLSSP
jgi:Zn-dependent protease with chaperone function